MAKAIRCAHVSVRWLYLTYAIIAVRQMKRMFERRVKRLGKTPISVLPARRNLRIRRARSPTEPAQRTGSAPAPTARATVPGAVRYNHNESAATTRTKPAAPNNGSPADTRTRPTISPAAKPGRRHSVIARRRLERMAEASSTPSDPRSTVPAGALAGTARSEPGPVGVVSARLPEPRPGPPRFEDPPPELRRFPDGARDGPPPLLRPPPRPSPEAEPARLFPPGGVPLPWPPLRLRPWPAPWPLLRRPP